MNSRQAKKILLLYRPGRVEPPDPDLDAALELTKNDAELARWFEEHCTVQRGLRAKFHDIPVPEGLKEQILSERKAHIGPALTRRTAILATATLLLAVTFAGLYLRPRKPDAFTEFRARMARIVLREYPKMDLETNDLNQIREFLAQHKAPRNYSLPNALERVNGTGCAILSWNDRPVSMICFNSGTKTDPAEPSDVFLFVIDHATVPKAPSSPQFLQLNKLATVSWTQGDKTYLLGAFGDEAFVRKFL